MRLKLEFAIVGAIVAWGTVMAIVSLFRGL